MTAKLDSDEARCKALWDRMDQLRSDPNAKPYAERRELCRKIPVVAALCMLEANDSATFDACWASVTADECKAIGKRLTERWQQPQDAEQQRFVETCPQELSRAEYTCFMGETFPSHCQDTLQLDAQAAADTKAPETAQARAYKDYQLEACTQFWEHVAQIAPDVKQPDETQRIERCRNIDSSIEHCVNRATDRDGYRACMHRLTPDQCTSLVASLVKKEGEAKIPPARQESIREKCPDFFVKATFDCLTDPKTGAWTCLHTIID